MTGTFLIPLHRCHKHLQDRFLAGSSHLKRTDPEWQDRRRKAIYRADVALCEALVRKELIVRVGKAGNVVADELPAECLTLIGSILRSRDTGNWMVFAGGWPVIDPAEFDQWERLFTLSNKFVAALREVERVVAAPKKKRGRKRIVTPDKIAEARRVLGQRASQDAIGAHLGVNRSNISPSRVRN